MNSIQSGPGAPEQDRTRLLQGWTVHYGAERLVFACQAQHIHHAISQCESAFPGEPIASAELNSTVSVGDYVVVGLPGCLLKVDGAIDEGPWFVIVDKTTGELVPDLMVSDVAFYPSAEKALEAMHHNIDQYTKAATESVQRSADDSSSTLVVTLNDLLNTENSFELDECLKRAAQQCHYDRELDVPWTYWHYGRHAEFATEIGNADMSKLFSAAWAIDLRLHDEVDQVKRAIRDKLFSELSFGLN